MKKELNPFLIQIMEDNDISDNVALFYFATLVKEGLKEMDDVGMKEAILTFMLDE